MLWHQRLGHIGEKGLRILHGKGMVEGMSNISLDFDFCENCVYGKQNWVSFPSSGKRKKHILELVHSDVFGPVKVPSLGKSVYYVSFIDDFSRNTCVYDPGGYWWPPTNSTSIPSSSSCNFFLQFP